jgi:hypothetical protein
VIVRIVRTRISALLRGEYILLTVIEEIRTLLHNEKYHKKWGAFEGGEILWM